MVWVVQVGWRFYEEFGKFFVDGQLVLFNYYWYKYSWGDDSDGTRGGDKQVVEDKDESYK